MSACELQAADAVELYFYNELDEPARASFEQHLHTCRECQQALEELTVIRSALATRPAVNAPADGDWRPFMIRLDEAIQFEDQARRNAAHDFVPGPAVERHRSPYTAYLALAAAAVLATTGVVYVLRTPNRGPETPGLPAPASSMATTSANTPPPATLTTAALSEARPETGFAALSEQHFERSKLVVLGIANKDPHNAKDADWAYERGLASDLLSDTRVYRLAAEERGFKRLASVMGDLEIVLLQTSLVDKPDPQSLEQIQRLIHKRDLVTKMDVAAHGL
jgi:hypothetical protein